MDDRIPMSHFPTFGAICYESQKGGPSNVTKFDKVGPFPTSPLPTFGAIFYESHKDGPTHTDRGESERGETKKYVSADGGERLRGETEKDVPASAISPLAFSPPGPRPQDGTHRAAKVERSSQSPSGTMWYGWGSFVTKTYRKDGIARQNGQVGADSDHRDFVEDAGRLLRKPRGRARTRDKIEKG